MDCVSTIGRKRGRTSPHEEDLEVFQLRFQNLEFALPRPFHFRFAPSLQPRNDIYSSIPQSSFLLVSPFTSYRTSPFSPFFILFIFPPCRWETEKIVALRHCVPRRRPSASNPSYPRSRANIIPSYMLAASLLSPVLPVGSVVLPLESWPGEHLFFSSFPSLPFHSGHPLLFL